MRTVQWLGAILLVGFLGGAAVGAQGQTAELGGTIGGPQEPPCALEPMHAMGKGTDAHPLPASMSPKARINDVMNAMMVPSSTTVWNAVATVTDATGVHESRPRTDEEWNIVYHAAVALSEVPNLLLVPGRERCVGGAIPPAYRIDFARRAREMQEAANIALIAAKKHDVDALSEAGERIDVACDLCHEKYQIAKGDPENWKKVLGTYKMSPEEVAAGEKDKAAEAAEAAKAKAAAPKSAAPKAAVPTPKKAS